MSDHCSEREIEQFCLSSETLDQGDRDRIAHHIGNCALCGEWLGSLRQFYQDLDASLSTPPTDKDKIVAADLLEKDRPTLSGGWKALGENAQSLVESFAEVIEPYRQPLATRIFRYVQRHPVRSLGSVGLAAIAVALAVTAIRPSLDKNPSYLQIREGSLIVYNAHGDELWRKHYGSGYAMSDGEFVRHLERVAAVLDVDGDGANEVVGIFGWTGMPIPLTSSVLCYQADGTERWKYDIHRVVTLGGVLYSDDYGFYHLESGDFARSGKTDIIGVARHQSWNPNFIIHLEGSSGRMLGEYLHPGELRQFDHKDLDHDGVDELIFGGQNNKLEHACLAVFDPRFIDGSAPAPAGFYPEETRPGNEKFYIMFAASDMKLVRLDVTNEVTGVRMTHDGMTEVIVDERGPESGTLYYYFDSLMNCVNVRPSDSFTSTHLRLEREGKLTQPLTTEYFEALKRGVLYWNGDEFVNSASMNKRYLQERKPPPSP